MLISAVSSALVIVSSGRSSSGSFTTSRSLSVNGELRGREDLVAALVVARHEADDGAVGRLDDGQRHDPHVGLLEPADEFEQRAHAVRRGTR